MATNIILNTYVLHDVQGINKICLLIIKVGHVKLQRKLHNKDTIGSAVNCPVYGGVLIVEVLYVHVNAKI
jgi:hypothetical protein